MIAFGWLLLAFLTVSTVLCWIEIRRRTKAASDKASADRMRHFEIVRLAQK